MWASKETRGLEEFRAFRRPRRRYFLSHCDPEIMKHMSLRLCNKYQGVSKSVSNRCIVHQERSVNTETII